MNENIKQVLKYLGTTIGLIALFNLLLYLVCLIPKELCFQHVVESSWTLSGEGQSYQLLKFPKVYINTQTDAVISNEVYSVDNKHPFLSYMTGRKNYNEKYTKTVIEETNGEGITANYNNKTRKEEVSDRYNSIGELSDFLHGKIQTSIQYGRYWHGNWVIYRPLFVLFNIDQIRVLFLIVFVILLIISTYLIYKKYSFNVAFIYMGAFICSSYLSASYSLESAPIFLTTMISMIILLVIKDKINNPYLFFFVIGMIVNYIDYFTVPLIPFFIPMSLLLLDYMKEKDLKECIIYLIKCGINYGVGYAITWVLKWALYDLFIPGQTSMIRIGFVQSFYRMKRTNSYAIPERNMFYYIRATIFTYCIYVLIVYALLSLKRDFINKKDKTKKSKDVNNKFNKSNYIFIAISLSPLMWFVLMQNHSLLHFFFTFRMYVIFMIGILLFLNNKYLEKQKG